jgi:multiple sugar transport system permease protein
MVNLALEPEKDYYTSPPYVYPVHFTLQNLIATLHAALYQNGPAYFPSLHLAIIHSTVVATAVMGATMLLALPAGYAFARFDFALRNTIFFLIIFARSLPSITLIIPYYSFYKDFNIVGTYQGVILAVMTLTVPIAVWVVSGVFSSLPNELDRQARIDGCSRSQALMKIIIPAASPGLVAIATITWLTAWNEYVLSTYLGDLGSFWTIYGIGIGPSSLIVGLIPSIVAVTILQRFMTSLKLLSPPMLGSKTAGSRP